MPEIKVYQDAAKAAKGYASWTFSVDGQASGYWCPSEYAVRRVIGRLQQGRSREAFGGPQLGVQGGNVLALAATPGRARVCRASGEARQVMAMMKGGVEKPRTVEPGWLAVVDGEEIGEFPTEKAARVACAFRAFMSRGKLGRLREAEAEFERTHGKKCCVAYDGKSVIATAEDGTQHAVRLAVGEAPRFKLVVPAPPK